MKRYAYWSLTGAMALLTILSFCFPGGEVVGLMLAVPTIVSGTRATAGSQSIAQATRVIDMSDKIHLLDPNMAPLTAISMKLNKNSCYSPKVEWLLDEFLPVTTTSATTITAGITALVVAAGTGTYFRAGDVVKVLDTGENVLVTAVATDTLTVTRAAGSTAAATITDTATLLIIGNANNEGAASRTEKTTQKTPDYNYTQIWRWPFSVTRTTDKSKLYGGKDRNWQRKKAGLEHRIQMERSLLFGERKEDTTGTAAIRFAGGLLSKITTNVSGMETMTMAAFEYFLRDAFRYGSKRKMFVASRHVCSWLSLIADTKLETRIADKSFPLRITEWISPHGTVYIVPHNLLTQNVGATHKYQGYGLMLDLENIHYRYLEDSDTKLKTNIQANDVDGMKDEYLTEATWQIVQEQTHAVLNAANGYT